MGAWPLSGSLTATALSFRLPAGPLHSDCGRQPTSSCPASFCSSSLCRKRRSSGWWPSWTAVTRPGKPGLSTGLTGAFVFTPALRWVKVQDTVDFNNTPIETWCRPICWKQTQLIEDSVLRTEAQLVRDVSAFCKHSQPKGFLTLESHPKQIGPCTKTVVLHQCYLWEFQPGQFSH